MKHLSRHRLAPVIAAVLICASPLTFAINVGDRAPKIDVTPISGEFLQPDAGKPTLVEFWATWCGPCRKFIPHMNELRTTYGDKLNIVAISTENAKEKITAFVKDNAMSYPVAMDSDEATSSKYMEGMPGIPAFFIIGADGILLWKGNASPELDDVIADVVAGRYTLAVAQEAAKKAVKVNAAMGEIQRLQKTENATAADFLAPISEIVIYAPAKENIVALDQLLAQTGKADTGIRLELIKKSIDVNQKDARALAFLARTLSGAERLADRSPALAIETAKRSVAIKKTADNLASFARVLYECGQIDPAIETLAEAQKAAEAEKASEERLADLKSQMEYYKTIKALSEKK